MGFYWGSIGFIRDILGSLLGLYWGSIGVMLGLYWDDIGVILGFLRGGISPGDLVFACMRVLCLRV